MAMQRFTIKLTQLRCLLESDPGPSEPYLWVTYFALGPPPTYPTGPLALKTPSYDAFRTEFPNNVSAGSVVGIPPFIASASFDMDLDTVGPKLLGCVVVLMEEDDTHESDIVFGRIAYTKEMETQLNALVKKRIMNANTGPLTPSEVSTIQSAVRSKVSSAVGSHQSAWDFFRDQDDALGFTYQLFPQSLGDTLHAQVFDFPEITTTKTQTLSSHTPPVTTITDRYVLSGRITVEAIPGATVDLCAAQRTALNAKVQEISGFQNRVQLLQLQLQHATPQQKPAIIHEIVATSALLDQAQEQLPPLSAALKACTDQFNNLGGLGGGGLTRDSQ